MIVFVLANIIQPLIDVFDALLTAIHGVVGSWGLSIVLLTVVVRAALLPLTFKQLKSMQNMQRLAPEIKKLQEKYKGDKQRMNQEMMRFYQENNVNPLSSCLPLVAQFPVFIALFYLLQDDLRREICPDINPPTVADPKPCGAHNGADFLFIPDLTNKATGAVLAVLIVLYVGTQLASTLMMSVTADKMQRRIFLALPFLFVAFIISFPAGLLVYWITTNTWTIGQQYIVRRTVGPIRPPMPAAAGAAAGGGSSSTGGGGLFGRLMESAAGGAKPAEDVGGAEDGGNAATATDKTKSKATAGNGRAGAGDGKPKAKPPPPPRRKRKQRSGRRR